MFQAKKSKEELKEVTHKVFFDVEIDGKPAGMLFVPYKILSQRISSMLFYVE